jgi:hypothetical protein
LTREPVQQVHIGETSQRASSPFGR